MAETNPYMNQQSGRRRGAHFAKEEPAQPVYHPELKPVQRKRRRKWPLVLLVLLLALAGGLFALRRLGVSLPQLPGVSRVSEKLSGQKKITVEVDGEEVRVPDGSTVQDVFEAVAPSVTAGDLLSVTGAVLTEGGGDAYAATLDGAEVAMADAATTSVAEGAKLSFANGASTTEEYSVTTEATSTPKLQRKVQEGTKEPGYMVQEGVIQYVYQWGKPGSKELRTGSISGETAEGNVVEGQDCVIMCQDIHPDNDEKLVALTFDDGPTNYTEQYMDVLDRYGIKATFNLIGEQVEDCADVVRANVAAQNQLCSHTWNHPYLPTTAADELLHQLNDTYDVMASVADCNTSSMRPPYGDIDINVWLNSGGRTTLSVYWTHDSEDWKLPGVDVIVSNCTVNMAPGSVILMHDGGGDREQTLAALPQIIEAWQDAGYRFVTMEELMASDSSIPEECCANYRPMPEDAVWPTELADELTATVVE